MVVRIHEGDLPPEFMPSKAIAVDTETTGLHPSRDRLCLVQLSIGDGSTDIVRIGKGQKQAPVLRALLEDRSILKIFHFARFDIAALYRALDADTCPVYCTKVASRLVRTYTDQHGLEAIAKEFLNLELNKDQQSSDWATDTLSEAQVRYAAEDVVHLHALKEVLDAMLVREGRVELASACFDFLPVRARLDVEGWNDKDIFSH